jgi:electron transport complex protein RnfC
MNQPIEVLPVPEKVAMPLLQHVGAPCEATVKTKDMVVYGDTVGDCDALISAPVHASISGKVVRQSVATLPNGRHVKTVPIKADGDQLDPDEIMAMVLGGSWDVGDPSGHDPQEIIDAIKAAGLVGLGGAAFPTYVKFLPREGQSIDCLLVNGCECEPYLTADYRLMAEAAAAVVAGTRLAARACGAARSVIVIEDNKPAAVEQVRQAAGDTDVEVAVVETKYPMGGERQVIPAVLGREVPTGGLPLDVGVLTINVGTAAAIARAVLRKGPLTHRVVTVTGPGIAHPRNLLAPIGAPYSSLIDACGGLKPEASRVVAGGPMMGFTMGRFDAPVSKGTSGIVVLTHDEVKRSEETACIRCGRCVDVCPLHLVPTRIALASRHGEWDLAKKYHIKACMECGCCAYVCPAEIPLVQLIRLGKAELAGSGS